MERGEAREHLDWVSQVSGTWQGTPVRAEGAARLLQYI